MGPSVDDTAPSVRVSIRPEPSKTDPLRQDDWVEIAPCSYCTHCNIAQVSGELPHNLRRRIKQISELSRLYTVSRD
jgi:hypothetical protein